MKRQGKFKLSNNRPLQTATSSNSLALCRSVGSLAIQPRSVLSPFPKCLVTIDQPSSSQATNTSKQNLRQPQDFTAHNQPLIQQGHHRPRFHQQSLLWHIYRLL